VLPRPPPGEALELEMLIAALRAVVSFSVSAPSVNHDGWGQSKDDFWMLPGGVCEYDAQKGSSSILLSPVGQALSLPYSGSRVFLFSPDSDVFVLFLFFLQSSNLLIRFCSP